MNSGPVVAIVNPRAVSVVVTWHGCGARQPATIAPTPPRPTNSVAPAIASVGAFVSERAGARPLVLNDTRFSRPVPPTPDASRTETVTADKWPCRRLRIARAAG